jgi:hypothetical protein
MWELFLPHPVLMNHRTAVSSAFRFPHVCVLVTALLLVNVYELGMTWTLELTVAAEEMEIEYSEEIEQ